MESRKAMNYDERIESLEKSKLGLGDFFLLAAMSVAIFWILIRCLPSWEDKNFLQQLRSERMILEAWHSIKL